MTAAGAGAETAGAQAGGDLTRASSEGQRTPIAKAAAADSKGGSRTAAAEAARQLLSGGELASGWPALPVNTRVDLEARVSHRADSAYSANSARWLRTHFSPNARAGHLGVRPPPPTTTPPPMRGSGSAASRNMDAHARYCLSARVPPPDSEPAVAGVGWHAFIDPRTVVTPSGLTLVSRGRDARHPYRDELVARAQWSESQVGRAYNDAMQLKEAARDAVSSLRSAIVQREEESAAQQEERINALVAQTAAATATATALAERSALAQASLTDEFALESSAALDRLQQERESLAVRSAQAEAHVVDNLKVARELCAALDRVQQERESLALRERLLAFENESCAVKPGGHAAHYARNRAQIMAMLDSAGAPNAAPLQLEPPSPSLRIQRRAVCSDGALSRESCDELVRYTSARFAAATGEIRRELTLAKQVSPTAGTGLSVESVGNHLTVRNSTGQLLSATEFGSTGRVPSGNDFLHRGARAPRVGEQIVPAAISPMFLMPFDPYYSSSPLVTAQARKFFNADPISRYDGGRVLPQEPLPQSPFGSAL